MKKQNVVISSAILLIILSLLVLLIYPNYIRISNIVKENTTECNNLKQEILKKREFKTLVNSNSLCKADQHLDCVLASISYNQNSILNSHNQLADIVNMYIKFDVVCRQQ